MKFKSLLIAGICAMAFAGTSCTDETKYTPGTVDVTDGAYFPTTTTTSIMLLENQQEFTVTLCRTNTKEAVNVALATNAGPEFTVPAIANFAPGQESVDLTVGVDFPAIEANKVYKFAIQIDPDMASNYGITTLNLSVQYSPWSEWERLGGEDGFGVYTSGAYWTYEVQIPVFERHSLTNTDEIQYRVGDPDADLFGREHWNDLPDGVQFGLVNNDVILTIDYNKSTGQIGVPPVNTKVHSTNYDEDIYMSDTYYYAGLQESSYAENNGLFELDMVYYVSEGYFGRGYEYLQLPGYVSDEVAVKLNGKYQTEAGQEMQVFNIFMSEGVSTTRYKLFDGSMSQAQAEATAAEMASDVELPSLSASGNVAINITDGSYTIVVVGVDASNNMLAWDYLTFKYVSTAADPNEGWTSKGMVLYGEDYFATVFSKAGLSVTNYQVEMQQNDETPTLYRLVNPYGEAWPYYGAFSDIEYVAPNGYLEFMIWSNGYALVCGTESNMVVVDGSNKEEIYFSSFAYEKVAGGESLQDQIDAGLMGSFDGTKMTMPTKSLIWWIGDQGYYGNNNGGFQINLNPDGEEEEEEEGYSVKSVKRFSKSVRNATVSNLVNAKKRVQRNDIVLGRNELSNYRQKQGVQTLGK